MTTFDLTSASFDLTAGEYGSAPLNTAPGEAHYDDFKLVTASCP